MTSPDLSIIVVNWNSKNYLRKCIASILGNTFGIEYEIIVVDSASFDGCGEMLQELYPQVRFIQSEHNEGFARANNLGVRYARGSAALFLNPDTEVRGHAIERLYSHLRELPRAGVVGCRLLNSDGTLQTSCVQPMPTILNQVLDAEVLQRWFPKISLWMSATMFEGVTSPAPVEAVSGACMMIHREVFEQVGGFSTDYFMYAEDLDLCYNTRKTGFTNYYINEAEIVHHGGGSTQHRRSRFSEVMIPESISRLLRKTHGDYYSLGYRLALSGAAVVRLAMLVLWLPIWLLKHKTGELGAVFNKWVAILRWGIGLEKWVQEYNQLK
ncbi:MAG: glycosyltransferase family 2 protein [Nitrososphaera sp.]|nr:glycosyltransferase family 2 protein [Nitrososphaera sp.]